MEEKERIRFVSPEPTLANILRARRTILLSEEWKDYVVDWIGDVGATMRTRQYMISAMASGSYYMLLSLILRLMPKTAYGRLLSTTKSFPALRDFLAGLGARVE